MTPSIQVERLADGPPPRFLVTVRHGIGESSHEVTIDKAGAALIPASASHEDAVVAAFHFLLDREPKESILRRFDFSVIARYFPEFADELPRYLAG